MENDKFKFINKPVDLHSIAIEGKRIKLRPISEQFTEEIFKEFTKEITRFMYPKTPDNRNDILDFIKLSIHQMKSCTDLVLVIIKKESNEFIGCCGLHSRGKVSTPELGVWIKKSEHGHKYGQEAMKSLVNWVGENIDFDYLVYPVDRKNIPSRKIPESLNGVIFKEAKTKTMNNIYLDEVIYKIANKRNYNKSTHSNA